MELLPTDIIHVIADLLPIQDKRRLLMTCTSYYKLKSIIMKNVIYHAFLIYYYQGPAFASIGIFNNIPDCRQYVIDYYNYIKKKDKKFTPIYKKLTKYNHYTLLSTRDIMRAKYDKYSGSHGFLVEEEYINIYDVHQVDIKLNKCRLQGYHSLI